MSSKPTQGKAPIPCLLYSRGMAFVETWPPPPSPPFWPEPLCGATTSACGKSCREGDAVLHHLAPKPESTAARGVWRQRTLYLRVEGLELFFLTVPEQGSPSETKGSLNSAPANFAPALSISLALILHFGTPNGTTPPSRISPKRRQLD